MNWLLFVMVEVVWVLFNFLSWDFLLKYKNVCIEKWIIMTVKLSLEQVDD